MSYSRFKKILIGLCLFTFSFAPFCWVCAEQSVSPKLGVSPHTFEMHVFPGETRADSIKITNNSEVPLPVEVRIVDFTASDEIGGMAFDESDQDISISSRKWFSIEKPNLILEAGETEKIPFTISVPEEAEPGGHYSVVLFEPRMPSYYFAEGHPKVVPVIGVLFLLSVKTLSLEPEASQKLEVIEFSVPEEERLLVLENTASKLLGSIVHAATEIEIVEKSPSSFILRIKNNDIYHIKPFGRVLIYNVFGKKIGEAEVAQTTILPGKIRQFPVEFSSEASRRLSWLPASLSEFLSRNLFIGRYKAILDLKAKSPVQAGLLELNIPTTLTFFSFPWKFWLVFIITFALLLFFVLKGRKRMILSLKTLLKKH